MDISFLRRLPGFGGRPTNQIVTATTAGAAGAEAALQHVLAELPELAMAAVVASGSGVVLASYTTEPHRRPGAAAAACWTAMVQHLQAAQAAQGQDQEQVEEILTTLASQLHLFRLEPGGQYFLWLAVETRDSNLALAREVMRQAIALLTNY